MENLARLWEQLSLSKGEGNSYKLEAMEGGGERMCGSGQNF